MGCRTSEMPPRDVHLNLQQQFSAPQELKHKASAFAPFEQQFGRDTGETNSTRRAEMDWRLRVRGQSQNTMVLKFDLTRWPDQLKPLARAWVAIGATNTFSTQVNINLNFSQNGIGMTSPLNDRISINNFDLMRADFAVKDGDVTVKIANAGQPCDLNYALHATIYVPFKIDPKGFAAKP